MGNTLRLKWSVPLTTRIKIHQSQALHTAHPQDSITINDSTNATCHTAAALKWFFYLLGLVVIIIQSSITTYPQSVVNGIVGKSANKTGTYTILPGEFENGYLLRTHSVNHADTSPPGAYPETTMMVGCNGRDTIM